MKLHPCRSYSTRSTQCTMHAARSCFDFSARITNHRITIIVNYTRNRTRARGSGGTFGSRRLSPELFLLKKLPRRQVWCMVLARLQTGSAAGPSLSQDSSPDERIGSKLARFGKTRVKNAQGRRGTSERAARSNGVSLAWSPSASQAVAKLKTPVCTGGCRLWT